MTGITGGTYEEAGRTKSFRNSTIEYARCDLCGKKGGLSNWKINQHRMGQLKNCIILIICRRMPYGGTKLAFVPVPWGKRQAAGNFM